MLLWLFLIVDIGFKTKFTSQPFSQYGGVRLNPEVHEGFSVTTLPCRHATKRNSSGNPRPLFPESRVSTELTPTAMNCTGSRKSQMPAVIPLLSCLEVELSLMVVLAPPLAVDGNGCKNRWVSAGWRVTDTHFHLRSTIPVHYVGKTYQISNWKLLYIE